MQDLLKRLLKVIAQGILWVFILSIQWKGNPVFHYAHEVFVDNALVAAIDTELGEIWYKLAKTARITFAEPMKAETEKL